MYRERGAIFLAQRLKLEGRLRIQIAESLKLDTFQGFFNPGAKHLFLLAPDMIVIVADVALARGVVQFLTKCLDRLISIVSLKLIGALFAQPAGIEFDGKARKRLNLVL